MREEAVVILVDPADRVVDVSTQTWEKSVTDGGFEWDSVERVQMVVPDGYEPAGSGEWRLIWELPIGCYEASIVPVGAGGSVTVDKSPPVGGLEVRRCVAKPSLIGALEKDTL